MNFLPFNESNQSRIFCLNPQRCSHFIQWGTDQSLSHGCGHTGTQDFCSSILSNPVLAILCGRITVKIQKKIIFFSLSSLYLNIWTLQNLLEPIPKSSGFFFPWKDPAPKGTAEVGSTGDVTAQPRHTQKTFLCPQKCVPKG